MITHAHTTGAGAGRGLELKGEIKFPRQIGKEEMEAAPSKKPRLDVNGESSMAASKTRIVLALCGSFSPITNSHMRLLGMQTALHCYHMPDTSH